MAKTDGSDNAGDASGSRGEELKPSAPGRRGWWGWLRRRGSRDAELRLELEAHLELEQEEQESAGLDSEQARYASRRALGNFTQTYESTREAWGGRSFERFVQDLRYGLRLLRRNPGFSMVAVLTLALGIGANTAIFSVVDAVLLRPLAFPNPDRLVNVWESSPGRGADRNVVNPINFLDWRDRTHSFEAMAAVQGLNTNFSSGAVPEALPSEQVSPAYFSVLGATPFLGRSFVPDEGLPGKDHVAILSYELWQRDFGGDRGVIGRTVRVNGAPATVVGVMAPGFKLPASDAQLWTPLPIVRSKDWEGGRYLTVIARLKPGVTQAQAQDDVSRVAAQYARERPDFNKGWSAEVVPMLADVTHDVKLPLLVLLAAVAFVLLIACANVANLLLVRSSVRLHEVAVRAALGAGKARIVVQLLTESLLLATAACVAGLAGGYWGVKALLGALPASARLPRVETVGLNPQVFGFAVAISLATVIVFGLVPALHVSRLDFQSAFKAGTQRSGVGGNRGLRRFFVVVEIALALLLSVGAGLMLRSFARLIRVNPGFRPERVLTMSIFTSPANYEKDEKRARYVESTLESIRAVPGVEAASSIHFLPLEERTSGSCFWPEGTKPNPADAPGAEFLIVSPDYFRTMNIAILRGRDFSPGDRFGGPTAMIVNRAFVDHFYPGENLIGRRFSVCWTPPNPAEVVGIVGDARQSDLESSPKPTIFLDNLQAPMYFATFVVRTRVEPKPMARAIEAAIHQVDPDQPVSDVQTMSEVFSDSVAQPRFQLLLLSVFAAIAVALAMIGVYGVLAYAVTQQRQEIGVRVALGAQARDVMRLIVREGLLLAVAGTSIGLVAAFALTRAVRSLLFEVTPTDPATLALASVLLLIVALAASVLPARRAVRLDPVAALRWE